MDILWLVLFNASIDIIYDIMGIIFFTICLVIFDLILRVALEVKNYLVYARIPINPMSILRVIVWTGWKLVKLEDGTTKRFLLSKNLRWGLFTKLVLQYPPLFLLGIVCLALPNVLMFGCRVDIILCYTFMLIPALCEVTSVIEKLNDLDSIIIWSMRHVISFVKYLRG